MPNRNQYGFGGLRLPSYTGLGAQTFPVTDYASGLVPDFPTESLFSSMRSYGLVSPNSPGLGFKASGTPEQYGWGNGLGIGDSFDWGDFFKNHGATLLSAAQGLGGLFMGMKQYGLAKDALKESKRQFALNYDAQRKLTNSRLLDRQRARVASDPDAHLSEEEYMTQFRI